MTKLYLDDERPTPEGWERCYTAKQAIECLAKGGVTEVSLDHDLGDLDGDCGDGYEVACWLEEAAWLRVLPRLQWTVHSANPSGAAKMRAALESADLAWYVIEGNKVDPND